MLSLFCLDQTIGLMRVVRSCDATAIVENVTTKVRILSLFTCTPDDANRNWDGLPFESCKPLCALPLGHIMLRILWSVSFVCDTLKLIKGDRRRFSLLKLWRKLESSMSALHRLERWKGELCSSQG